MRFSPLIPSLLFLTLPCLAVAQVGGAGQIEANRNQARDTAIQQQVSQGSTAAPGYETEAAPASPGDADLGEQQLLKRKDDYKAFSIFGDLTGNYTNNVALVENGAKSAFFLMGQAGASWNPRIKDAPEFLPEVTVRQQFFRYERFSILDFDSLNAGGGLTYLVPEVEGLILYGRYNYNRFTDADQQKEFYRNHTLTFGVQKTWAFAKAHYLFAGFSSEMDFTDPYLIQRDDHGLYLGYHADLSRSFSADVYTRVSYLVYDAIPREDLNHVISLGFRYKIQDWVSVGLTGSYVQNYSNQQLFDYRALNSGAALDLIYRF